MKRILNSFSALLVCLLLNQTTVQASSHREAPLISNDPLADNTDVYAFRSPCDDSKVVLIANYIPFQHPAGGPNWITFGENIRYEIHVKNSATTTGDDITYRFTFTHTNGDPTTFFNIRLGAENIKTTYTLEKSEKGGVFVPIVTNGKVPPPNIGPRSIEGAAGLATTYDQLMTSSIMTAGGSGGEKVYAGPADDPFFVDLGGAFDLGGFRKTGRDGLAKMNVHSICVEVPISTLQKEGKTVAQASNILDGEFVIGVWASASRQQITTFTAGTEPATSGNWIQVSRLGMPLTNEVINPIGDKDRWNATSPYSGAAELSFAKNFVNPELGLYMDDSRFGTAVPGLADLRIQTKSLATAADPKGFDFRNDSMGLYKLKGNPALVGTAFDPNTYGNILLPDNHSPRSVDLLPIFYTGVPNLAPYQLATGKNGNPLAVGKPFINNFLPTLGDLLRLNMAVPVTPRNSADFSSLGIVKAAVLGLTDSRFNGSTALQNIPNMDGFPNGRRLEDDVTTIELQAVSGVALAAIGLWYDDYTPGVTASPVTPQLGKVLGFQAGVTVNDTTLKACFPYVQGPWRGFVGASYVGVAPCGDITDRIYVDNSAATSGSGAGWACAKKELSDAIQIANTNPAIKSIWVADGMYKPGTARGNTLMITRADLKILGGFSGNETLASQANPKANPTIISGDIGTAGVTTDNTYHLMDIHSVPANASALVIDGFTFENGYANVGGADYAGALYAYYNAPGSVQMKRNIFRANYASSIAGAIYMDNTDISFDSCSFMSNQSGTAGAIFTFQSNPVFSNCLFAQNNGTGSAGAYYGNYGSATFNKTIFNSNTAAYGGAVFQNHINVVYNNSVFSNNSASEQGGGIYQHNSSLSTISNTTFYNNAAVNGSGGGGILLVSSSSTSVQNSIFYNNKVGANAASPRADVMEASGVANSYINSLLQANTTIAADNGTSIRNNVRGTNPAFVNESSAIGADGVWFTADDGLRLTNGSPVRNIGSNALAPAGTDILNNARIACTTVDLGAYENQVCTGFIAEPNESIVSLGAAVSNPFTNSLQIKYTGTEKAGITVTSGNGKIMTIVGNTNKGISNINTQTWTSGIYQVEIVTPSGKKTSFKVIKL